MTSPLDADTESAQTVRSSPRNVVPIIILCLVALGIHKISRHTIPDTNMQVSGPHRGDVLLSDCLPVEIYGWKKQKFIAGKFGEFLCSHSWQYSSGSYSALVSFDQAEFSGWHELSDCYTNSGWEFQARKVVELTGEWPCVVSHFKNSSHQNGVLVYSLFDADGKPVVPTAYSSTGITGGDLTMAQKFLARVTEPSECRTRQCQVFSVSNTPNDSVLEEMLMKLHSQSRNVFADQYLKSLNQQIAAQK